VAVRTKQLINQNKPSGLELRLNGIKHPQMRDNTAIPSINMIFILDYNQLYLKTV
tara:strand:- start:131 stop:295 length:165 start_codon:yes stop_codon:yes gene_type:complete